jgi:cytochrome c oxidase subunit 3
MATTTMSADEHKDRTARSKKLLLWFAMASMTMMFAGITSAFVVSKSREDWMNDFQMPVAFYFSTLAIILCSVTFHLAKKAIEKDNRSATTNFLLLTLGLGITFVFLQFKGFDQLIEQGYYFTGPESNIATTFLYVIAVVHLAHLAGGMISLLIIIYNHFKQKYN